MASCGVALHRGSGGGGLAEREDGRCFAADAAAAAAAATAALLTLSHPQKTAQHILDDMFK